VQGAVGSYTVMPENNLREVGGGVNGRMGASGDRAFKRMVNKAAGGGSKKR
jgi:hypothetical protein